MNLGSVQSPPLTSTAEFRCDYFFAMQIPLYRARLRNELKRRGDQGIREEFGDLVRFVGVAPAEEWRVKKAWVALREFRMLVEVGDPLSGR